MQREPGAHHQFTTPHCCFTCDQAGLLRRTSLIVGKAEMTQGTSAKLSISRIQYETVQAAHNGREPFGPRKADYRVRNGSGLDIEHALCGTPIICRVNVGHQTSPKKDGRLNTTRRWCASPETVIYDILKTIVGWASG